MHLVGCPYYLYQMCVSVLSTTFVWNISHSKKNSARCDKCFHTMYSTAISHTMYSTAILLQFQWNTIFFSKNFRKKRSSTKFDENPSRGNQVVTCGRTGRHEEERGGILAIPPILLTARCLIKHSVKRSFRFRQAMSFRQCKMSEAEIDNGNLPVYPNSDLELYNSDAGSSHSTMFGLKGDSWDVNRVLVRLVLTAMAVQLASI